MTLKNSLQSDDALQLLYQLHSSLNVSTVINNFANELKKIIDFDSIQYQFLNEKFDICIGGNAQHSLSYPLKTAYTVLGEIIITRNKIFHKQEISVLKHMLTFLLMPLKNALSYHQALQTSLHDPLTGAANLTSFHTALKQQVSLAKRHNTTFSILAFDLDHFKKINDKYGHGIGDEILKYFTEQVTCIMRESDMLFRTGGEEFMVLLAMTDITGATHLAEKIRKTIEQSVYNKKSVAISFTTSIGVTSYIPSEKKQHLLERVDQALYRAKRQGRNCVYV